MINFTEYSSARQPEVKGPGLASQDKRGGERTQTLCVPFLNLKLHDLFRGHFSEGGVRRHGITNGFITVEICA